MCWLKDMSMEKAVERFGRPLMGKYSRSDDVAIYAIGGDGVERPVGFWKPRPRCAQGQEVISLRRMEGFYLMEYSGGNMADILE